MNIQENVSLRALHTFHVSAAARYFARFSSAEELFEIPTDKGPLLLLGGGSNILFLNDFPGLVLKNEIKGIDLLHEDPEYVYLRVGAGENWHQLVMHTVERGWGGLENLSLIPGCVGAAPIQNIGAYGVELEDSFWDLEAYHFQEKKLVTFTRNDCSFGYRDSVFKNKYKGQFAILHVTFRLRKHPVYHTRYGALQQELEKRGVKEITLKEIAHAVMQIRSSKLPDPDKIGSAGSFFKNPSISKEAYDQMLKVFPGMPSFSQPGGNVKIPAGWLIEQCGWKGYRKGDAGCFPLQALVLVNYGNASGGEIKAIADAIASDVQQKFGIALAPEVNIL